MGAGTVAFQPGPRPEKVTRMTARSGLGSSLALSLAVAAAAAAPASARPVDQFLVTHTTDPAGSVSAAAPAPSASGFDWGDAEVGAGAGAALAAALIAAGGVLTLRHRRGAVTPGA
jgi:hypothetical protein